MSAVDLGILNTKWIPISIGSGIGLHQGINVAQGDGLFTYYSTLLSAPVPYSYLGWIIVAWDAFTFLAALYGFYRLVLVPVVTVASDILS